MGTKFAVFLMARTGPQPFPLSPSKAAALARAVRQLQSSKNSERPTNTEVSHECGQEHLLKAQPKAAAENKHSSNDEPRHMCTKAKLWGPVLNSNGAQFGVPEWGPKVGPDLEP